MNTPEKLQVKVAELLSPLPGLEGGGVNVRYDPTYQELRSAREFDDPILPMGEWERPLKKADWRLVERLASELLMQKTKDIQLAAWLVEAWIYLYQVEGFIAGVDLLSGLVEDWWDEMYPEVSAEDADPRMAPFLWIKEHYPYLLRVQIHLLVNQEKQSGKISLADWELSPNVEPEKKNEKQPVNTRASKEEMRGWVTTENLVRLWQMSTDLRVAKGKWELFGDLLTMKAGNDSPSMSKVGECLLHLLRAIESIINGRALPPPATAATRTGNMATQETPMSGNRNSGASDTLITENAQEVSLPSGPINSREEAYRLLDAAADYLHRTEPHSPTPYMVKKAVSWGQLSLADLMKVITREGIDIKTYYHMLGVDIN